MSSQLEHHCFNKRTFPKLESFLYLANGRWTSRNRLHNIVLGNSLATFQQLKTKTSNPSFKMVLPAVLSLADCTDFSKTVSPYLPQLYDLPQKLLENYSNFTELQKIYLATNPLIAGFAISLFIVPIFVLISEINRNYSQVDRAWSILPTVYNAHFVLYAHLAGLSTSGLDNLLACSVIWSVRAMLRFRASC